jgi:hypothetical protein
MQGLVNYSDSDSEEEKASNQKSSYLPPNVVQSGKQQTTTKHLSLSFLPHAIQRALTMGVSAADSDSDSDGNDISASTKRSEITKVRDSGIRTGVAAKGTQAPKNSLIATLPKPLNKVTAHDGTNSGSSTKSDSAPLSSSRWVLPNSSASWTSSTSTAKTSKVHEPHDASRRDHVQSHHAPTASIADADVRHLVGAGSSGTGMGGGLDDGNGGLFTLCDPTVRRPSSGVAGMHKPMSMPSAMSSLASTDGPGPGPGPALPSRGATDGSTTTSPAVRTMLREEEEEGSSNALANEPPEEGGRVNRRKREREIEQMIQSGDLSAVHSLGDHVSEANAPTEWDRERYAQRQQAVEKVRKDYNATAADVANLEKKVTLSHKRNHQITALAVQAVAVQLKNVDGTSKRF